MPLLKANCELLPKTARDYLKILVDSMNTASLEKRFDILKQVLLALAVQRENEDQRKNEIEEILNLLKNLELISSNLSFRSGSARQDLFRLQTDIRNLKGKIDLYGQNLEKLGSILEQRD